MSKEKAITFVVTKDCQLACKYCYQVGKNSKERMSLSLAKRAVDIILSENSLFTEDKVVWDFIGGEPLLEIELINEICNYIHSECERLGHKWRDNYSIRITTNGLLYNNRAVQQFIQKYKDRITISISFDGIKEKQDLNRIFPNGSGSYDKVIVCVKKWIEDFVDVGTKMVISSEDIPYIKDSGIYLLELGIRRLDMNFVLEDVWKEGDDKLIEEQLIAFADAIIDKELYANRKIYVFEESLGHPFNPKFESIPCGSLMLSVDSAGLFYTCMRFAKFSLTKREARIVGNVQDGIDKNKLRPYYVVDELSQSPHKCRTCEVATGCRWCPAENYDNSETGTMFERFTAICKIHKAKVRAKNYYWNKLKAKNNYV